MESESWKPVVGFEGLYEVSNLGRVRSLDRVVPSRWGKTRAIKGRVLRLRVVDGYSRVCLYARSVNGIRTFDPSLVHRLVAMAFLPSPAEGKTQVNHVNFDRSDNRPSHLEWVSPSENVQHSVKAGRWDDPHDSSKNPRKWKKLSLDVAQQTILAIERGEVTKYRAAKNLGISNSLLTIMCRNRARYFPVI